MTQESDLIQKYFSREAHDASIIIGIGDDAAVLEVPDSHQLLVSTDTLIEAVHFPEHTDAADIGWKAMAVNLSDMAAMAAKPKWASLSLTLPDINESWLHEFSQGLFQALDEYALHLVGGDICRGPLTLTVTIQGLVKKNTFVTRAGARPNDNVYVTGTLGDAGAGLSFISTGSAADAVNIDQQYLIDRLNRPTPRVTMAQALSGHVSAMIDISDGLMQDLGHIITASHCGALLKPDEIPCSDALLNLFDRQQQLKFALTAGDDYELCFTASPDKHEAVMKIAQQFNTTVTRIGEITSSDKIEFEVNASLSGIEDLHGFDHFDNL